MTTFFASEASEGEWAKESLVIEGPSYHHLFRVKRLVVGDRLRVADGKGHVRSGSIAEVDRRRARVDLGPELESHELAVAIELFVPVPKKARAEWLVEKTVECGVRAIRFLLSERGPRKLGSGSLARLARIVRGAAEQSDRSILPEVTGMHSWTELPGLLESFDTRLVFDRSGQPLGGTAIGEACALMVGPEGGFSPEELRQLENLGCQRTRLAGGTLRVETAAVVAVGVIGASASSIDTSKKRPVG